LLTQYPRTIRGRSPSALIRVRVTQRHLIDDCASSR
jgi:hypothetical protein